MISHCVLAVSHSLTVTCAFPPEQVNTCILPLCISGVSCHCCAFPPEQVCALPLCDGGVPTASLCPLATACLAERSTSPASPQSTRESTSASSLPREETSLLRSSSLCRVRRCCLLQLGVGEVLVGKTLLSSSAGSGETSLLFTSWLVQVRQSKFCSLWNELQSGSLFSFC